MAMEIFNRDNDSGSFNMTPIIDIVFLLIIFFLVVSQFIEAENFEISLPGDCEFAQSDSADEASAATVTIMKISDQKIGFAVGAKRIHSSRPEVLIESLARSIDARLDKLALEDRVVTLRIDKDIYFSDAQYALAAVASSKATKIKMAALKGAAQSRN
ncbi:ExbD/TolR family protein [Planctomycetota bacterium]